MRTLVGDVETYSNFWCVTFWEPETDRVATFRLTPGGPPLDVERLRRLMTNSRIITFNGINYDVPMIFLAISGADNAKLKRASDYIITEQVKPWIFEREYKLRFPRLDHIDIIDVAPGMVSLKLYGGRLHAPKLQDLPYEPDAVLTPEQIEEVVAYNINDLRTTWLLYQALLKQIELRERMRDEAGIDLRSKKDAQVAAAVLKHQIEKIDGRPPEKSIIRPGTKFRYDPPAYLTFKTPEMQAVMQDICGAEFEVLANGKTLLPRALEGRDVRIGDGVFRMGIGGLHSQESGISHYSDDETLLIDRDVESYYPNLMLTLELAPRHLGKSFLMAFGGILKTRLHAKHNGNKVVADSLKIVVNSTFGMTGSKYSFLYDPKVMIQVTVTGQLALLRLIESAHLAGINVISANTDGIVVKISPDQLGTWNAIIAQWEIDTKLKTEETRYDRLFSRDVNNYIAIKTDGGVKTKGAYGDTGPQKNPSNEICVKAVLEHLTKGVPLEQTIFGCDDIRQFVSARTVQGGSYFESGGESHYLGKVVRWYLAEGSDGLIRTKKLDPRTGNWKTVAKTTGCRPLMDLPDALPDDLDYDRYIAEAKEILMELGAVDRPPPPPKVTVRGRRQALKWLIVAAISD